LYECGCIQQPLLANRGPDIQIPCAGIEQVYVRVIIRVVNARLGEQPLDPFRHRNLHRRETPAALFTQHTIDLTAEIEPAWARYGQPTFDVHPVGRLAIALLPDRIACWHHAIYRCRRNGQSPEVECQHIAAI
jgi:hypothetical protein